MEKPKNGFTKEINKNICNIEYDYIINLEKRLKEHFGTSVFLSCGYLKKEKCGRITVKLMNGIEWHSLIEDKTEDHFQLITNHIAQYI